MVAKDKNEAESEIDKIIDKFGVSKFDRLTLGKESRTISVAEIREARQKLHLQPLAGKHQALLIYNAQNLTPEAQNAILKTLEEVPENAVIVLTVPNEHLMLPTIISRCQIVRLKSQILNPKSQINSKSQIPNKDSRFPSFAKSYGMARRGNDNLGIRVNPPEIRGNPSIQKHDKLPGTSETTFLEIQRMDLGGRFRLAEELTKKLDKDETLDATRKRVGEWLAAIITILHHHFLTDATVEQDTKNLKSFLAAQKQIRKNLNVRLVLENCLMQIK